MSETNTTTPAASNGGLPALGGNNAIGAFASLDNFVTAQRMAQLLASSTMVPKEYQGNPANCVVALELASRLGCSVFMVMQNLDVIHGRPSLRGTFLIATVNTCGRYTPLAYEWRGKPGADDSACRAIAYDKATGQGLEGTWITWDMVKREGWLSKAGSKWQTMPEQMFRYRAASFWARAYAPDVMLGMQTSEETREETIDVDVAPKRPAAVAALPEPSPTVTIEAPAGMAGLGAALDVAATKAPAPKRAAKSTGFETPAPMSPEEIAAAMARERAEAAG